MKNIDLEKEQELLARAQQDKSKFSDLYQYYLNDVYRFSYSICGNQHDAEDIASQTFIEMFNYLPKFEWKGISLKFWLFRTAKNITYKSFEKSSKAFSTDNFDAIPEAKQESFEKLVLDKDEQKLIVGEIEGLNPSDRELINLRVWEDMSFEEISTILDQKSITVRQRFYRAVEKVRNSLENKNYKRFASVAGVIACFSQVETASAFSATPVIAASITQSVNILIPTTVMTTGIIGTAIASAKAFVATNLATTAIVGTTAVAATVGGGYVAYNNYVKPSESNQPVSAVVVTQTPTPTFTPTLIATATPIPEKKIIKYIDDQVNISFDTIEGMQVKVVRSEVDEAASINVRDLEVTYNGSVLKLNATGGIGCTADQVKQGKVKVDAVLNSSVVDYYIARTKSNNLIAYGGYSSPENGNGIFTFCDLYNIVLFTKFDNSVSSWFTQLDLKDQNDLVYFDKLMTSFAVVKPNTRSEAFILNPDPNNFPGTSGTLNGLKSDEVLTQNDKFSYTLKSPDFTMQLKFEYEGFDQAYKQVVSVGSGASYPTIYRAIMKNDINVKPNQWFYTTEYTKTGTCDGMEISVAPCGAKIYSDLRGTGPSNYFLEMNLLANNSKGLQRADEIVKAMTFNKR